MRNRRGLDAGHAMSARVASLSAVVVAGWLAVVVPTYAQTEPEPSTPAALTGTLARARDAGAVIIGYRESSVPFSYLSSRGEPIGYSIELCKAIVEAVSDAVHKTLAIQWLAVNPGTRIDAVASGRVDLECGSTTSNLERQKVVAFSPILFVAGTKLLVKKGSPVKSFRDLAGQAVAVTGGTTNEKTMRDLSARFKLNLNLLVSPDHAESFALVKAGKAAAFATDDVLLYGFIAQDKSDNQGRSDYEVVGEFLSYDPYGVMFRKGDAQLAAVIHDTFVALAQDGEIERQYKRWFLRKLPSGTSIDLPMSPQLETIIQTLGGKTE
jgi:glutamate/aspartate transport system substrate-binding protein